ncbi:carboxyl-terminal processing protease [Desulfopila aestuarii DSM 18488]|uniref:Carboxyl-terminal processing protease n=2 Tax=Desulfopila aestuarii TaxID=231440 RepID=A0A1M7YFL3_9BACT|nr:carboxyl-terminal processing protease [Desulfopila aestuarii DSM 18488]
MMLVLSASCLAWAAPLEEIRQILREKSLKPPAESQLAAMSDENLLQKLREIDNYARYFESDEYHSPMSRRESWVGIGADLVEQDGKFFLAVYHGGAAELAGIADHSRLIEIDGKSVAHVDVESIADSLKGMEGTSVSLFVEQPGGRMSRFQVEREMFSPLDVEPITPGVHQVLRIRRFVGGLTKSALLATLDFLGRESRAATGARSDVLIIDLRDAGGGDLYEAFDVAGLFLPQGAILGTMCRRADDNREIRSTDGEKFTMPMALLVGPDTASAAEVFAGTLQQYGRAKLIGQRTFGKCVTQTDVHLSDGSVLRYTNAEVRLPDGTSCSGVGLQPDRDVRDAELRDLTWLVSEADALL